MAHPRKHPGVTPGCRIVEVPGTPTTYRPGISPDRSVIPPGRTVIAGVVDRLTPPGYRCAVGGGDRRHTTGICHRSSRRREGRYRNRGRSDHDSSRFPGRGRQRHGTDRFGDGADKGFSSAPRPRNTVDQIAGRTRRLEQSGHGSVRVTTATCDGDSTQ